MRVSISPNFLCLSFGTWSIEASYQNAAKLKFKAAFDVKEYGEQSMGQARSRAGDPEEALWHTFYVPGPELCAGKQGCMFQSLEVARVTREGAGQGGD